MMGYFITNISFHLLVKELLKSVNLAKSQANVWLCHMPHWPYMFVLKDAELVRYVYYGQKLLLILVTQIDRLMWVYYQQISNCRIDQFWLTDWQTYVCHQWLTDCWSCMAFCCNMFFFVTPVVWFLYGRCKHLFVTELKNKYFTRQIF